MPGMDTRSPKPRTRPTPGMASGYDLLQPEPDVPATQPPRRRTGWPMVGAAVVAGLILITGIVLLGWLGLLVLPVLLLAAWVLGFLWTMQPVEDRDYQVMPDPIAEETQEDED